MKKYVLTFLAAMFAAFSAQAVVLSWAISETETFGSGDDAIVFNYNDVVAVAVYRADSNDWKLSSIPYDELDDALLYSDGSQRKSESESFGPDSASGTFDVYDGYWYVVIFKSDGTYLQGDALSWGNAGEADSAYISPDDQTPPAGEAWNPAVGNGTWDATGLVPEPTSMALFALGIAAVGLRRRVKK